MSYQGIETLSKSELKAKLNKMGMSLDRNDHPKNYYKKLYLEKSNAKNKVTRDNTPFYQEQIIINKKRQRTSSKKSKPYQKIDFNAINEEEDEEEYIPYNYSRGIKTTRLIESKKKIKPQKNEEIYEEKRYLRSSNKLKPENEIIKHDYNLRSTSKHDANYNINNSEEKNIIKFGAQNKNNIHNTKNPNKDIVQLKVKNQKKNNYDYIIKSSDKKNIEKKHENNIIDINEEEPIIITQDKRLYRNPEQEINNVEKKVENKDIITNMEMENNKENENESMSQNPQEQKSEYSETSSYYSTGSSRFSRFTNYTYMSLTQIGNNIVNLKNSVMNKFRRNAFLLPLVILILFGIIFFLNEKYENFERNNIFIIFSIIMGLIILFHLFMYIKDIRKYKKIAKEDKKKLIELLESLNIRKEEIGNNIISLNRFFEEIKEQRMRENGLNEETYMKYVFPNLIKYLKKDGYCLEKRNCDENNNYNFWKEL